MTISLKEAAARYGVKPSRLQKALKSGRLPGVKILGRWSIDTAKADPIFNHDTETD